MITSIPVDETLDFGSLDASFSRHAAWTLPNQHEEHEALGAALQQALEAYDYSDYFKEISLPSSRSGEIPSRFGSITFMLSNSDKFDLNNAEAWKSANNHFKKFLSTTFKNFYSWMRPDDFIATLDYHRGARALETDTSTVKSVLSGASTLTKSSRALRREYSEFYSRVKDVIFELASNDDDYFASIALEKTLGLFIQNTNLPLYIIDSMFPISSKGETRVQNTIRALALIKHPLSHDARRMFIEKRLKSGNKFIRDIASSALAVLNDKKSLESIYSAIERESYSGLKADLIAVANQIVEKGDGPISPDGN